MDQPELCAVDLLGCDIRRGRQTHLEDIPLEHPRALLQVPGVVHLAQVVLLRPRCLPHLDQERLGQVQEFVTVEIRQRVRLVRVEILSRNPIVAYDPLVPSDLPDLILVHHLVGASRVDVLVLVAHDRGDVRSGVLEDDIVAPRVVGQEGCDVEDFVLKGDVA